MNKIILSIDTKSLKNQTLKLHLNSIFSLEHFKIFTDAYEFRKYVNKHKEYTNFWILSSDNIEAINLAASCKKDRPNSIIYLITKDFSSSLNTRAKKAKIDKIMSIEEFNNKIISLENNLNINKSDNNNNQLEGNFLTHSNLSSENKSYLLSVISATGGSGKSTIATMCGVIGQTIGYKTLLIDADFQFGEIARLLNITNPLTIDELITDSKNINKLSSSNNLPALLAPPSKPELAEKVLEYLNLLIKFIKQHFELIIVNTSTFWNEIQALLIENDNKSLFLIDQTPNSIYSTKIAIDLCDRCGIPLNSVLFCLNKCSKNSLFTTMDVSYAINGMPVYEISDGKIDVSECMSAGNPSKLISSNNVFTESIIKILNEILPKRISQNQDNIKYNHKLNKKFMSLLSRK